LLLDPRFAGSNPAEDDEIFKGDKNQHDLLRRGSKVFGPMWHIYGMLKNTTSLK
jgi:hypothetical protein